MAELSTIARPYAEALFRVAAEDASTTSLDAWSERVANLATVAADPGMQQLIGDPRVTPAQLYDIFTAALAGTSDAAPDAKVENFLRTLIANDRLSVMPVIATQFAQLVDAQRGSAEAQITSAFPMSNADVEGLVAALEKKFEIKLRPNVTVDQDLIGGVRVVVGDRVLDTSVRSRLAAMKAVLTA